MIEHIWSILCTGVVIDGETNTVSIHNVVEQLTILAEPIPNGVLPIAVELITLWGRQKNNKPDDGIQRVIFETPSGKLIVYPDMKIDLSAVSRHRQRVKFPSLQIDESGWYYFKVELKNGDKWKQVAAIPLEVTFESPKE